MRRWLVVLAFLALPVQAAFYGPYALTAPIAIDGDSIRADVAIWPDMVADVISRVAGGDTPEKNSTSACERDLARKAREFTDAWVQANAPLLIGAVKPDKYSGRVDAVVTGKNGTSLSQALISAGHGRAYTGGARQAWCQ